MKLKTYELATYAEDLEKRDLLATKNLFDQKDRLVSGVTFNSKDVEENTLFICKGAAFKVEYLEEALEKGAIGYVSEVTYDVGKDVPHILVTDIRKAMAPIASLFYNYPQDKIKIIGVGGTKGKTTTTYFLKAVLDEYLQAQNKKPAGIISSIITYDGLKEEEAHNTTPEAVELIRHLANAVQSGLEYFVIEASSQAFKYHRTDGIRFDVAIFLNIEEDHISPIEHPNYEDYLESKLKMFKQSKQLVINNETSERDRVLARAGTDAENYQTFSLQSEAADYFAYDIQSEGFKTTFKLKTKSWQEDYELAMPGLFNVENASAVIAAMDLLNVPQSYVQESLAAVRVPGRTEFYQTDNQKIVGVVDFAHNRLSFESLCQSVKEIYPNHHIISVFGAPGGKALGRREELGSVAGRYSDHIYLTMEDPAHEEVTDISEEIGTHIKKHGTTYSIIEDRVEAIQTAFDEAQDQTVILVTGKGHETSNNVKGISIPYATDIYHVKQIIEKYNKNNPAKGKSL